MIVAVLERRSRKPPHAFENLVLSSLIDFIIAPPALSSSLEGIQLGPSAPPPPSHLFSIFSSAHPIPSLPSGHFDVKFPRDLPPPLSLLLLAALDTPCRHGQTKNIITFKLKYLFEYLGFFVENHANCYVSFNFILTREALLHYLRPCLLADAMPHPFSSFSSTPHSFGHARRRRKKAHLLKHLFLGRVNLAFSSCFEPGIVTPRVRSRPLLALIVTAGGGDSWALSNSCLLPPSPWLCMYMRDPPPPPTHSSCSLPFSFSFSLLSLALPSRERLALV